MRRAEIAAACNKIYYLVGKKDCSSYIFVLGQNVRDMSVFSKEEIVITGVSYRFISGGKKHPRAKKYPYVYGYTDSGQLRSWRIPSYLVPIFKLKIKKVRLMACPKCFAKFKVIEKEKGEEIRCPVCS